MKRFTLVFISLFLLIGMWNANSATLDSNRAKNVAVEFMTNLRKQHVRQSQHSTDIIEAKLNYSNDALQIFNFDQGGFVIIGSDEHILAYSEFGAFYYDKAPAAAKKMLNTYSKAPKSAKSVTIPDGLPGSVQPLLGETAWNQDSPYNMLCPVFEGYSEPCPAGCTPIALAQIMYYHKYPEHGYGNAFYMLGETQIGADLSQSTYQWDLMKDVYTGSETEAESQAVALLVRDAGFALNTQYSPVSSSTSNLEPVVALVDHFNFDKSIRNVRQALFDDNEWLELQYRELAAGRPYYYGGRSETEGGHSLVCDGYDSEGRIHYNFGWGGIADGYYSQADMPYSLYAEIIVNIKPDEGGVPQLDPYVYTDLYWDGEHITFGYQVWAGASNDTPFVVAMEFESKSTGQKFYSDVIQSDMTYAWTEMLYPAKNIKMQVPDGNYTMRLVIAEGTQDDVNADAVQWQYFHFKKSQQSKLYASLKDGLVEQIENTEELYDPLDEGLVQVGNIFYSLNSDSKSATVMRKNSLRPSYSGDVTIPAQIEVNGTTYTVNAIGRLAFEVCRKLGVVTIPYTVETIEYGAFSRAEVDDFIFEEGSKLREIEYSGLSFEFKQIKERFALPEGLQILGDNALSLNVRDLIIPQSVQSVGYMGLSAKASDIFFQWPEPLKLDIDAMTFQLRMDGSRNYYNTRLHVPAGSLAQYAPLSPYCHFEMDEMTSDQPIINATIDDMIYQLRGASATLVGLNDNLRSSEQPIDVPGEVEYEGKSYKVTQCVGAFYNAKTTAITFPSSVRVVSGINACSNLRSVIFPDDSRLVSLAELFHCPNLTEVILPPHVQKLSSAFVNCQSLSSISLPGSINWISDSFSNTPFESIYAHWLYPIAPFAIMNPFMNDCSPTIYVPEGVQQYYANSDDWGSFSIEEDASLALPVTVDKDNAMSFPKNTYADYYMVDVYDELGTSVASSTVGSSPAQSQVQTSQSSPTDNMTLQLPKLPAGVYQYVIRATSNTEGNIYYLEGKVNIENITSITDLSVGTSDSYDVYNTMGMRVARNVNAMQLNRLSSGIYILRSLVGEPATKKILIK